MAEYTLLYTGDEVKTLLAKISEQQTKIEYQEQGITTLRDSISQPGQWIQQKRFTQSTSANGNLTFDGLVYGKFVVLCVIPINDVVAIPYYQTPGRKLLGAHIIRDTNTYAAVTNTEVTVDVWYYEIPSV